MGRQEDILIYNLKLLRYIFELSQAQVAALLKIDRSTYSYYETGKTLPSVYTLVKLSKIYNVSCECLFSPKFSDGLPPKSFFALTSEEKFMLYQFRLLNENNSDSAYELLRKLMKSREE